MLSAFKLARTLLLGAATVLTVACDDGVGLDTWTVQVDTATLYSLSRLDLMGLPSGYDFVNHVVVEVGKKALTAPFFLPSHPYS